jgi:hypothetical protein
MVKEVAGWIEFFDARRRPQPVAVRGHLPAWGNGRRLAPVEPAPEAGKGTGLASALLVKARVQRLGGERGRGHAAPVGGVEAAGGIPQDEEILGEACLLVVTATVRRATVAVDGGDGLGVLYRVVDGGAR